MVVLEGVVAGGRGAGPDEEHHGEADNGDSDGEEEEEAGRGVVEDYAVDFGENRGAESAVAFEDSGDGASAGGEVSHVGDENRGGKPGAAVGGDDKAEP